MKKSKKANKRSTKSRDLAPKKDAKGGWGVIAALAQGVSSTSSGGTGGGSGGGITITKSVDSSTPELLK